MTLHQWYFFCLTKTKHKDIHSRLAVYIQNWHKYSKHYNALKCGLPFHNTVNLIWSLWASFNLITLNEWWMSLSVTKLSDFYCTSNNRLCHYGLIKTFSFFFWWTGSTRSAGSLVPSPFTMEKNGRLVLATLVAEFNQVSHQNKIIQIHYLYKQML